MRNAVKVSILLIVLVIPVLIFLFLKEFGKNHYTLPYYHIGNVTDTGDTLYAKVPTARLDKDERVRIVSFFSLPCLADCKERMAQLNRVQDNFKQHGAVQLISYLADTSEGDGAGLIQDYRVTPSIWKIKALESTDVLDAVMADYRADYWPEPQGETDDIAKFILIDAQGHYRGYYDGQMLEDVDRLILEVRVLLNLNQEEVR